MKCPNYIKIEHVVNKKGKASIKIKNIIPPQWANSGSKYHEIKGMQVCGGEIICNVRVDMDGECNCSATPVLTVLYTCSRCKSEGYCDLPKTEEDLSLLLTRCVKNLPEWRKEDTERVSKEIKEKGFYTDKPFNA